MLKEGGVRVTIHDYGNVYVCYELGEISICSGDVKGRWGPGDHT